MKNNTGNTKTNTSHPIITSSVLAAEIRNGKATPKTPTDINRNDTIVKYNFIIILHLIDL